MIISDTHALHEQFTPLQGNVLIHCGDMFDLFDEQACTLQALDSWFARQAFDVILCTGGNHDFPVETALARGEQPFRHAVYLQDASYIHAGICFWGAPWVPFLDGHAFYADETALSEKWARIPSRTDVLITHTPPSGIIDVASCGSAFGCEALHRAVQRVRPALHCFGHVHESRGELRRHGTRFVNASSVQGSCERVLAPIVIDL
ncbi:MAG: metallophosphoesterase [Pseudomonadota bacterium]